MTMRQKIQRSIVLAVFCGFLVAPTCGRAQASTSPALAAPADVFNKILTVQEKEFIDAADAMPEDKFNFAPTMGEFKGVRTFGSEVTHVAGSSYYFFGKWNVPGAKDPDAIEKLTGKAEIMQALRDSFAFEHAALSTITASNAFEQMGPSHGTRVGTAAQALAHTMDHYGQMVEYLRMNGIVPPASRK
jgi:uncharacterized damage-inducible protein DinB